jgi:integrase
MATLKITKRVVDGTRPGARDLFIFDSDVKGFGLRVRASGAKTYVLAYRAGRGRQASKKRVVIGTHGSPWTPETARREAQRLLLEIANGCDPAAARATEKRQATTVADLCDRYLADHVETRNKASTAKEFRRLIERAIKPRLGRMAVSKLSRADVAKFHHAMRATPRSANQALAVLSRMCSLAELWGEREENSNPCRLIDKFLETKRERFLSDSDLERLGKAMTEMEGEGHLNPSIFAAIRLAALTGCRVGELLALRWGDIEVERSALSIRDAKAGARLHPIGAETLAFLAALPRGEGAQYVLPAASDDNPLAIGIVDKIWARLRVRAGLGDARVHDLRHTVGTFAGATGANAFLVRDKLGHRTLAMTGRYVNRDADPLRALSDKVESRVASAMGGTRTEGAVVSLRRPGYNLLRRG